MLPQAIWPGLQVKMCLGTNATLYGANTSDFPQNQLSSVNIIYLAICNPSHHWYFPIYSHTESCVLWSYCREYIRISNTGWTMRRELHLNILHKVASVKAILPYASCLPVANICIAVLCSSNKYSSSQLYSQVYVKVMKWDIFTNVSVKHSCKCRCHQLCNGWVTYPDYLHLIVGV